MRSWRSKFDDEDEDDDGGGGGDRDDEQQTKQGREKSRAAKCEDHGSGTREPESTFPPTPRRQTVVHLMIPRILQWMGGTERLLFCKVHPT